jgi:hypothetical protein
MPFSGGREWTRKGTAGCVNEKPVNFFKKEREKFGEGA